MKNKLFILVGVIVVLIAVAIPAFAKRKPKHADGIWCYTPLEAAEPEDFIFGYQMDANSFLTASYDSDWTGTFTGTSDDNALVIWSEAPTGPAVFVDLIAFDSVEVGGQSGGLEMYIHGAGQVGDWEGGWFITGASGALEGLEGHGEWWGPGYLGEGCGITYYTVDALDGP